tara:strand:- start:379 stop:609 length:231 start_codon:yes stop_codon:yes gene_type:complete
VKTRDYTINGIMITDCPEKSHEYNMKGIPSMTDKEVYNIQQQIKGKMPAKLKSIICDVKTTIGGTVKKIWVKSPTK